MSDATNPQEEGPSGPAPNSEFLSALDADARSATDELARLQRRIVIEARKLQNTASNGGSPPMMSNAEIVVLQEENDRLRDQLYAAGVEPLDGVAEAGPGRQGHRAAVGKPAQLADGGLSLEAANAICPCAWLACNREAPQAAEVHARLLSLEERGLSGVVELLDDIEDADACLPDVGQPQISWLDIGQLVEQHNWQDPFRMVSLASRIEFFYRGRRDVEQLRTAMQAIRALAQPKAECPS